MLALPRGHQVEDLGDAGPLLRAAHGAVIVLHSLGQVARDATRDDGLHLGGAHQVVERPAHAALVKA